MADDPEETELPEIVAMTHRCYRESRDHSAEWRQMAPKWFDLVANRQWDKDDIEALEEHDRIPVVINRVARTVNAIIGTQVSNRQETRYIPREEGDVKANEVYTGAADWVRDNCDAEDEESDAFEDTTICGMGWCLSGNAMVRLPNTHFATTRLYSGNVIQIDLENGQQLTGTPNHPVLTDTGWKRLCDLHKGDNLVNSAFLERVKGFPVEQFDQVESRLEDKIDAFRAGRKALRVRTAPDDFYADGAGSKVHVVYADRALRDKFRDAARRQKAAKNNLIFRKFALMGVALLREGLFLGASFATKQKPAVAGLHSPCFHLASNDIAAKCMAFATQAVSDGFSRLEAAFGGNLIGRQKLIEVEPNNLRSADFGHRPAPPRTQRQVCRPQAAKNHTKRYSEFIRDFFDWKPILEVEARNLDRSDSGCAQFMTRITGRIVKSVDSFPVHDVGTSLGMFVAGNIITSNTETRMDMESDPEGTISIDRIDPLEMYWDPNAKKRNVADKRWVLRLKPMPADEFDARWPDQLEGMLTDPWESPADTRTREHVYPQDAYNQTQPSSQAAKGRKTVRVAQIQWAEREPMYRVGKMAERITAEAFKELKPRLDAEKIPYMKQTGVRWKQAFVAGGKVLEEGDVETPKKKGAEDCPYPDGPTMRCITYKRDRNKNTWYGVVAAMMDPQKYGNKFMSLIMDIVRSNAKGGVMMEKDAVDNPTEIEEKWSRPDALVFLRPGAIAGNKIKERPKAELPGGLDRLVAYFLDSVHEVTGINLELLGMANREQAGVLENTRKQAGVTIIAPLFDGLRRYRKEQGRVLLYFIQTYLSDGRLVRILGENGQQYIPLTKQPGSAKFDVIVDESPTSPNMKERTFAILSELMPNLMKAGVPIPPDLLDYAPLPSAMVQKWKEYIEQNKNQPDPEQMQKMQEEFQKLQQENQELKQKKDERMAELQMDQVKAQQEMQIEQQKMQLEREKMQVEIEIQRVKLQLEQEKAQAQLQLEQQKTSQELALNQHKTQAQLQMAEAQNTGQMDLERQRTEAEIKRKLGGDAPTIDKLMGEAVGKHFPAHYAKHNKKRNFKIVRGKTGDAEALVEE